MIVKLPKEICQICMIIWLLLVDVIQMITLDSVYLFLIICRPIGGVRAMGNLGGRKTKKNAPLFKVDITLAIPQVVSFYLSLHFVCIYTSDFTIGQAEKCYC